MPRNDRPEAPSPRDRARPPSGVSDHQHNNERATQRGYGSGEAGNGGGTQGGYPGGGRGGYGGQHGVAPDAMPPSTGFDAAGGYASADPRQQPVADGSGQPRDADPHGRTPSEYDRGRDGAMPGRSGGLSAGAGPLPDGQAARTSGRGKGPKNFTRNDERIREDVCHALEDAELDASDIDVRVANGEVTLEGTVADVRSQREAEQVARGTRGVKQCHNLLRVGATDQAAQRAVSE